MANPARPPFGGMEELNIVVASGGELEAVHSPRLAEHIRERTEGKVEGRVLVTRCPSHPAVLLQAMAGTPFPEGWAGTDLDRSDVRAQFDEPLFGDAHVFVGSVASAGEVELWRDADTGSVVSLPGGRNGGSAREGTGRLERVGPLEPTAFEEGLGELVRAARERGGPHIIFHGASTYDPRPQSTGVRPPPGTRHLHAMNLAVLRASSREGLFYVDVDRAIAEMGARAHVTEPMRYTVEACDRLAAELVDVLAAIGFFEPRPLVMHVGKVGG